MTTIRLKAIVTEDRQLKVDLPEEVPPGEIEITLELDSPITPEELQELMTFRPATGAEIVQMLEETNGWWTNLDIQDGLEWVEAHRRKQEQNRQSSR